MKLRFRWTMIGIGLSVFGLAIWFSLSWQSVHSVRVTFLDVGQGDAILIQAPGGFDVLIDGGPDTTLVEKLGERLSYFDRTIELIVVTHPDSDHVAGLVEVSRRYRVQKLLGTLVADELPAYSLFLEQLEKQGTEKIAAQPGQSFNLPNAELTILGPAGNHVGEKPKDSNALSVVVRLDTPSPLWADTACGTRPNNANKKNNPRCLASGNTKWLDSQGRSFLFTGDADFKEENEVMALSRDLQSDVLKVGHHGSKSSTSDAWLKAVKPAIGIISAGRDNRYGHPHPDVIERLKKAGVAILSTIEEGDICIEVVDEELRRC